jgi:hypothetical protein
MNSTGCSRPRTGWYHRTRGSESAPAADVDDGLVEDRELVPVDGAVQLAGDREPSLGFLVHRRLEQDVARLSIALGDVHRGIGIAQQIIRVVRVGAADRDPDADPHEHMLVSDTERFLEGFEHAISDLTDLRRDVDVLDQQRELVTAESSDSIAGPDHRGEPRGHRDQQLVARGMTEAVIDQFEIVEVDDEHTYGVTVAMTAAQRMTDSVDEQGPVGQARQAVVQRLAPQLGVEALAVGDVTHRQDETVDAGDATHIGRDDLEIAPLATTVVDVPLNRR